MVEYLVVCQIIYLSYMYKDILSENIDNSLNKLWQENLFMKISPHVKLKKKNEWNSVASVLCL